MLAFSARRPSWLTHVKLPAPSTTLSFSRRQLATGIAEGGTQDPSTYCSDLVRKRDYESFLISHFWPRELREHFIALRAFYVGVVMRTSRRSAEP